MKKTSIFKNRSIKRKSNALISTGAPTPDEVEEFIKKIKQRKIEPIPERIEKVDTFISLVTQVFDMLDYDVEIKHRDDEIEASIKLDVLVVTGFCKDCFCKLLDIADEITMHPTPENETKLFIRYYTHEVYFDGRKTRNL